MATSIQADPIDVALVAIDAELTAARLVRAVTFQLLSYVPDASRYEAVALRVRLWAAANDCVVREHWHSEVPVFEVIDPASPTQTPLVVVHRPREVVS